MAAARSAKRPKYESWETLTWGLLNSVGTTNDLYVVRAEGVTIQSDVKRRISDATQLASSSIFALLHRDEASEQRVAPDLAVIDEWLQTALAKERHQLVKVTGAGLDVLWDSDSALTSLFERLRTIHPFPSTSTSSIAATVVAAMRVGGGIRTDTLLDRPRADTSKFATDTTTHGFGVEMATAILEEFLRMCQECIAPTISSDMIKLTLKSPPDVPPAVTVLVVPPVATLYRKLFAYEPSVSAMIDDFLLHGPSHSDKDDTNPTERPHPFTRDDVESDGDENTPEYIFTAAPMDTRASAAALWVRADPGDVVIGQLQTQWVDAMLAVATTAGVLADNMVGEKFAADLNPYKIGVSPPTDIEEKDRPSRIPLVPDQRDKYIVYATSGKKMVSPYKFMTSNYACETCAACRTTAAKTCSRRWPECNSDLKESFSGGDIPRFNVGTRTTGVLGNVFDAGYNKGQIANDAGLRFDIAVKIAQNANKKLADTIRAKQTAVHSKSYPANVQGDIAVVSIRALQEKLSRAPVLHFADEQMRTTKAALWKNSRAWATMNTLKNLHQFAQANALQRLCIDMLDPATVRVTGPSPRHVETLCIVHDYFCSTGRFAAAAASAHGLLTARRGWHRIQEAYKTTIRAITVGPGDRKTELDAVACLYRACDTINVRAAPKHLGGSLSGVAIKSMQEAREHALAGVFAAFN